MPGVPLSAILERLPSDCERRVSQAKDRLNKTIRDVLRRETALRLARSDRDRDEEGVRVPVRLRPGLPARLQPVQLDETEAIALILSRWRGVLEGLKSDAAGAKSMIAELGKDERFRDMISAGADLIGPVDTWAESLLRRIAGAKPLAKILIDEDVLGIYRFCLSRLPATDEGVTNSPQIELYWAVIGLVADFLGVSTEDLTGVVLAHELAHAYTHVGVDIDGFRWNTAEFAQTERRLVERLAQYYTSQVCTKLEQQSPGLVSAYSKLLDEQPATYHGHVPWTNHSRPEEVRFAVIETRRRGIAKIDDFNGLVQEAGDRWRRDGV